MASYDFISTAVMQCELKSLIGNKGNGLIKRWIEFQPGMLEFYINEYGLEPTIEGITQAYKNNSSVGLREIKESIESFVEASGGI